VAGLGLGLYLARTATEATRFAWSLPAVLALVIASASAGLGLARYITQLPRTTTILGLRLRSSPQELSAHHAYPPILWPALPLWLYVLWPRQDPAIAWGVGLVSLLAWLLSQATTRGEETRKPANLPLAVFLISFTLYLFTLPPGLQPADGGEFQLVAARFGVAHPPGYPLYSSLGGLFVRLPLGPNPAWRLNLFSAITAAATLALVSHTAGRMTANALGAKSQDATIAGLVAAVTLGSATTYWATATTASIRPMTALFTALVLYALTNPHLTFNFSWLKLHVSRPTLFAFILGLGLAHHVSLFFFGIVGLTYLLLVDTSLLRQPRRWPAPIAALTLTQLVWLYLPLRDAVGAPLAPGNLSTVNGLTQHILARGFAGDLFAFAAPEYLPDRLILLPTLLRFQFSPLLLAAAAFGALSVLRRDWRRFILLVGGFALHTFVTLTYRAPQTVEYAIPAYVALALLVGEATIGIRQAAKFKWQLAIGSSFLVAVTLVAGILSLLIAWPNFRNLAQQDDARQYAESLLQAVPESAIVLSNWHWATPMWYLQQVEGLRPDVQVQYVAPQGESLAQNWVEAIVEQASERPTVVVRYFEPEYRRLPYRFEPLGPALIIQTEFSEKLPADLTALNVDLGGQVRLLGYALDTGEKVTDDVPTLRLGQSAALTLAWTPLQPLEGDLALFAHLLWMEGLVGQGSDRRHAATDFQPGQIILDRFLVYPVVGAMPDKAQLTVGAYRPAAPGAPRLLTDDGADQVTLVTVRLRPADLPPITRRGRRIPFVDGPTLVGVDWDTTVHGQLRLYLHWQGRADPTTLDTAIRQGDEILAQTRVSLSGSGYVSSAYDLPRRDEPLFLTTDTRAVGAWGLGHDRLPLPAAAPSERYVPIGGEMILMIAEVDKETVLLPGDHLRYDLRLVASQPLLRDRIISVSLVGLNPDGSWAWRAPPSDGVPALGAIPTFKWIHRSTVLDRHRLILPSDASAGPAFAWLQVYDHYTQAILPPLDLRLLRQGLLIPLDTWTVSRP
jgi:hypothetical protein